MAAGRTGRVRFARHATGPDQRARPRVGAGTGGTPCGYRRDSEGTRETARADRRAAGRAGDRADARARPPPLGRLATRGTRRDEHVHRRDSNDQHDRHRPRCFCSRRVHGHLHHRGRWRHRVEDWRNAAPGTDERSDGAPVSGRAGCRGRRAPRRGGDGTAAFPRWRRCTTRRGEPMQRGGSAVASPGPGQAVCVANVKGIGVPPRAYRAR